MSSDPGPAREEHGAEGFPPALPGGPHGSTPTTHRMPVKDADSLAIAGRTPSIRCDSTHSPVSDTPSVSSKRALVPFAPPPSALGHPGARTQRSRGAIRVSEPPETFSEFLGYATRVGRACGLKLWSAVAAARRFGKKGSTVAPRLVYRSRPSLRFRPAEIGEVAASGNRIELTLDAPGLASPGSALPGSDIERIARVPALAEWLDGPLDRFMHAVEGAHARSNEAFALASGAQSEALRWIAFLAGGSAPLAASPASGLTCSVLARGGAALGAWFVGSPSAAGLAGLLRAYTGLEARVAERTGAMLPNLEPARVGAPIGGLLGGRIRVPDAGVDVILEGAGRPDATGWGADPVKRASLCTLLDAYVGGPLPKVRIGLRVDGETIPAASLDGNAHLGGICVLGRRRGRRVLPIVLG